MIKERISIVTDPSKHLRGNGIGIGACNGGGGRGGGGAARRRAKGLGPDVYNRKDFLDPCAPVFFILGRRFLKYVNRNLWSP